MKKIIFIVLTVFITLSLTGCSTNPSEDYCVETNVPGTYVCEKRTTSYFDTTISLKLYYTQEDEYDPEVIFEYFQEQLELYHFYFDNYNAYSDGSNIYTINHTDGPTTIDQPLFDAIKYGLEHSDIIEVDGVPMFNIALGPVLEVWHDARNSTDCDETLELGISYCPVPRTEIDEAIFNTDVLDIILDEENLTIEFAKEAMSIDLGGYAKGYFANLISTYLNELNITYLLNLGQSNIIANNPNPTREDGLYYIALTKPTIDFAFGTEYFLYLKIPEGISLVTSGINQRFFKGLDDTLVYHHIIDPTTNYPGGYSMSVTIIYPDSAIADILSTALFLMPLDDALAYVNSTENLEAVWYIDEDNVIYSDGFESYIFEID